MAKILLACALCLMLYPAIATAAAESHWESYATWVISYTWNCFPYYYTVCQNWFYYPYYVGFGRCGCSNYAFINYAEHCYTATGFNCYTGCLTWVLITQWRCQLGWTGYNCDVPICDNPTCNVNQICKAPNVCDCPRSSTGECSYQPCDDGSYNCYPGTCNKNGNPWVCECAPGFSGPNCQTISYTPTISDCYVQIFGTPNGQVEQEVARANECAAVGFEPQTAWIGKAAASTLTKIVSTWQANYENRIPLPAASTAPYILNAPVPIGIAETYFSVTFPDHSDFQPQKTWCINPGTVTDNPPTIKQCKGQLQQWNDLGITPFIKTNASFIVSMVAYLGGRKRGNGQFAGGRFDYPQDFSQNTSMNTTIRKTKFAFDLEPPYHCLSRNSSCQIFPIFLNESMTNNPVIEPDFNQWNDDGSGIDRFYVEVYYMTPDSAGILAPFGDPLTTANVNITLNNFRYTCKTPGAYSIFLTVYDKANNSAKARKVFNYDDHDSSVMETSSPIYLGEADPDTNYQFITTLAQPKNGIFQFTVNWTNHFICSYNPQSLGPVKPLGIDSIGAVIDDQYGTNFGLRSVDRFIARLGILGYEIAYSVDKTNGGIGATQPGKWESISDGTIQAYQISITEQLKDGDTILVWLRYYDLYGQNKTIKLTTYIDTSRFNIKINKQSFKMHYPDIYNSSVELEVSNNISGIKKITYEIYDDTTQLGVNTGTALPTERSPLSSLSPSRSKRDSVEQPCTPSDPSCYCTAFQRCFNVIQLINIDNCLIDRRVAGHRVTVKYTIYSLSGWSRDGSVNAGTLSESDIPCRSSVSLSTGAIIGICIGIIIPFLLLLILLILMCIRWRVYRKHPIPTRLRTTIHNTFGRHTAPVILNSENEIYGAKGDSVQIKKSNEKRIMATNLWDASPSVKQGNSFDKLNISNKDVQIGDILADGRFAVIRKGFLLNGNERTPVAIKALKSGYDKGDPEVMKTKINFMSSQVKPHPNIIRFVGAIPEDMDHAAPIMLLELCDKPLKDWLSEISQVDAEVLEDMLNFTLHIARGVQHLHDQRIIHRRLAVRNVLLKRTMSGWEAKLIGFGPSRDDSDDNSSGESTIGLSTVPLKWMAPETLNSLTSKKPIYDEKTDTWSYGVTIWEIYSKGAAPYANHKSMEIAAVLKRGERLTCPEDCPPDLFNQVAYPCWNSSPKKRPNFTKICNSIEQFRNGVGSSTGYYVAPTGSRTTSNGDNPPGYYAARDVIRQNNNASAGLYQDARSE